MIAETLQQFLSDPFYRMLAIFLVGTLGVGQGTVLLAPTCYVVVGKRRVEVVRNALQVHWGQAFFAGLATVLVQISLLYVLTLLGFTAPLLSALVSVGVWFALILGYAGMSLYAVDGLLSRGSSLAWVVIGAMLITILQVIPLFGPLLALPFVIWSLGASVLTGLGSDSDWLVGRLPRRVRPSATPRS